MLEPNTIIQADVLEGLDRIPDRSVDLIMTSPPYADARAKQYGGVPADRYTDWYRPVARALLPKLRKQGSYILNIKEGLAANGERSTYVHDLVAAHRAEGWRWHDEFIWHKPNGRPGDFGARLRDAWEHCFWFTRIRKPWIDKKANRTPFTEETLKKAAYWDKLEREGRTVPCERRRPGKHLTPPRTRMETRLVEQHDGLAAPTNMVELGVLAGDGGGGIAHPAAFPARLPAWFIRLLCPPDGGMVLDPFLGSGTTAVAAEKEGRSWWGIDRSPEYCRMAAGRIEAARERRSR